MKTKNIVTIAIISLLFASCSKWLTINPQDQIKESEIYSSAEGFHTQINGLYKSMATASLYGRELSYGLIEAVAQYYDGGAYATTSKHEYRNAAQYDYEYLRTKVLIQSLWDNAYNVIANANSVLKYIKSADSEMFRMKEIERKTIEGEALAIRAFMLFDMYRLYAPSLKKNSSGKFLPYSKEFPVLIPGNTETKEYMQNIISDLELAHKLTMDLDTLVKNNIFDVKKRLEFSGNAGEDRFTSYRGYRLNHYAIKAMLARVYLFVGNNANALKYASELIELQRNRWFKFTSSYNASSRGNVKLYDDVIFALYNNKLTTLFNDINPLIDNSYKADYLNLNDFEGIFGNDINKDYRAKYQYASYNNGDLSLKYALKAEGEYAKYSNKMIPMIRMSEIYYIAAEAIFDTDKAKAEAYIKYVKTSRGASSEISSFQNKDEFISLVILNEVRRELFGEGQLFYFYKRHDLPIIIEGDKVVYPGDKFSFPIPDSNDAII